MCDLQAFFSYGNIQKPHVEFFGFKKCPLIGCNRGKMSDKLVSNQPVSKFGNIKETLLIRQKDYQDF
jgi:hypothetical protein